MHNLSELQVEIHIYKQITNTSQVQTVEKLLYIPNPHLTVI